ncbi:histidine kinase [Geodermatophilus sp. DSM 44513]|uniref:sensor histidine kinase n=1 Tax=Geodermatophilus sp. DSM 44513 TaxID=1528104 RepID=UPI00126C8332|nr:histidine kinase [Geodermatophilus sp. DSM 44513]WNV76621.1 histidine kinase [Geodermatophilus sp. DSM 44513]
MLRTLAGRPAVVDSLLAGGLSALTVVEAYTTDTARPPWLHAALSVAAISALALRRRYPLAVLCWVVAGMMVVSPESQLSIFGATVVAAFTAGVELTPPRSWIALGVATLPFFAFYALLPEGGVSDYVAVSLLYGGPWAVGRIIRDRTARAVEAAARAERAEVEREQAAARAVADERARIARELHDVVSHSISVITVQTQAVRRRLATDHQREADDLRAVEATARQAMAEMRRLFGILRADGERPSLAPQPGLDQLDRLVADTRAAGVTVALTVEGEPVPLPPGLDLAAYRVVQEALTNVRRHAPGGRVGVRLAYGGGGLEVQVENGPGAGPAGPGGGGLGLVGMRERVVLYGGSLEAGPQPGGGFAVHARLPFREGVSA